MTINFEFVRKDEDFDGAKIYSFEAIHVTTTRNNRKYTLREMELGARSLSFRPLNRNHDHNRWLPHPESSILVTDFDKMKMAVTGEMRIADPAVINLIESGKIKKLSIEQVPTKGENCSSNVCEQNGVVFTGMALLDIGVTPGDERAEIKTESLIDDICISEACRCRVEKVLTESVDAFPELSKDMRYAVCKEVLAPMNTDEAWKLYNDIYAMTPEQAWKEYNSK